jgi:Holliday junction resolvase RusA-like endonuclease
MEIIIPGIPESQTRMKFSRQGNFVRVYDPKDKEKKIIREELRKAFGSTKMFEHPHISFIFKMPIPSSTAKKVRDSYDQGHSRHEKKPDIDNLIKLWLDCMDGICFEGDQKVSLGDCFKLYHPNPCTRIIITEQPTLTQFPSVIESYG